MQEILYLRLKSIGIDTDHAMVIHPKYMFNEETAEDFVKDLMEQINASGLVAENSSSNMQKLLIPLNLYGKHWVGMTVEFAADGKVIVNYMDSEGAPMPKSLQESLQAELARSYPDLTVEITEKEVELQKSNNCGLQMIENLIAAVAGEEARINPKDALTTHAVLYEQQLIEEALQEEARQKALDEKLKAADRQLVEKEPSKVEARVNSEEGREEREATASNENDYAVEERAWQASASVVTKSTQEADTIEQPAGSGLQSNHLNIPEQPHHDNHQDSFDQAKYEAEMAMREMRETREKTAEASTLMPPNEVRYGATIGHSEVAASVQSAAQLFTGKVSGPSGLPTGALELTGGVRSNPTDSVGASRPSKRSKDDLIKDMEKEHSATGFIGTAFPPSSLSFDVPDSQPWSEEFQVSTLGKEFGIGNDN